MEDQPKVVDQTDKPETKRLWLAALGYVPFLCFIPLLMKDKGDFLIFHARQGLVLTVVSVVLTIIGPALTIFILPVGIFIAMVLNTIFGVIVLVGAIKALQGECWELPVLGGYAKRLKF
ncbi:MAG: DUF4870 domain-containing protein [Patescibacteria group bacterium]